MTTHEITIDHLDEASKRGDIAFAAYCSCEDFDGEWHHADQQHGYPASSAFDCAYREAEADGQQHLLDVAGDDPAVNPPDGALFRALPIPTTDQNGYAR